MNTVRIYLTGRFEGDVIYWNIAPLPVKDEPQDGELDRLAREGAQTQELIDDMEDRAFWARGEW